MYSQKNRIAGKHAHWTGQGGLAQGKQLREAQRGFTLIELMVVLLITAILAGLAVPSMSRFLAKWQMNSAVNAFTSSMRLARSEAVKSNKPVYVCASTDGATCITSGGEWKTGWLVYLDINKNAVYNPATDKILGTKSTVAGMSTLLAAQTTSAAAVQQVAFMPNGLSRGGYEWTFNSSNSEIRNRKAQMSTVGKIDVSEI